MPEEHAAGPRTGPESPSDPTGAAVEGEQRLASPRAPEPAMRAWIARCRELAESGLDGIEDPANELALLAAGDRGMMERARRVLTEALERAPDDPVSH